MSVFFCHAFPRMAPRMLSQSTVWVTMQSILRTVYSHHPRPLPSFRMSRFLTSAVNPFNPTAFTLATSKFPNHWEMHYSNNPPKEFILYIRKWEAALQEDAKDALPRWTPEQRDIMLAACIQFRFVYNPNQKYRVSSVEKAYAIWRRGLEADARSKPQRWTSSQRMIAEKTMELNENTIMEEQAAREHREKEEWEADFGGFWGKIKLLGLLFLLFVGVPTAMNMLASKMNSTPKRRSREVAMPENAKEYSLPEGTRFRAVSQRP